MYIVYLSQNYHFYGLNVTGKKKDKTNKNTKTKNKTKNKTLTNKQQIYNNIIKKLVRLINMLLIKSRQTKHNQICLGFVCLFVLGLSSHSRILHYYGDVTIAREGLQTLTYTPHSLRLSSEGSLTCHTYCDTGLPFKMVMFEEPWHSGIEPRSPACEANALPIRQFGGWKTTKIIKYLIINYPWMTLLSWELVHSENYPFTLRMLTWSAILNVGLKF